MKYIFHEKKCSELGKSVNEKYYRLVNETILSTSTFS